MAPFFLISCGSDDFLYQIEVKVPEAKLNISEENGIYKVESLNLSDDSDLVNHYLEKGREEISLKDSDYQDLVKDLRHSYEIKQKDNVLYFTVRSADCISFGDLGCFPEEIYNFHRKIESSVKKEVGTEFNIVVDWKIGNKMMRSIIEDYHREGDFFKHFKITPIRSKEVVFSFVYVEKKVDGVMLNKSNTKIVPYLNSVVMKDVYFSIEGREVEEK